MNEREFLDLLRYYFRKVKPEDVEEILSDYKAHFTEARERGLSDAQIAAELGHPEDIYASYQSEGIVSEKTKMEKISDNAEYLAESHNGPPRKYYKITEAGRTEYIESVREWSDFTKAVNMLLTEGGEPNE